MSAHNIQWVNNLCELEVIRVKRFKVKSRNKAARKFSKDVRTVKVINMASPKRGGIRL